MPRIMLEPRYFSIASIVVGAELGLGSYRTAWILCAKLRRAWVNPEREPLCGMVEADETIIPSRKQSSHHSLRQT
jgi:hypothetical protein